MVNDVCSCDCISLLQPFPFIPKSTSKSWKHPSKKTSQILQVRKPATSCWKNFSCRCRPPSLNVVGFAHLYALSNPLQLGAKRSTPMGAEKKLGETSFLQGPFCGVVFQRHWFFFEGSMLKCPASMVFVMVQPPMQEGWRCGKGNCHHAILNWQ